MSSKSAPLLIATLILLTPVALKAQHGHGGYAGSAYHDGSYTGSVSATRSTTSNLGGRPYGIRTDIPTPIGLNAPAASYTGILPGAYPTHSNFGGRYGRGGGALIGAPLYYPYLGYDPSLNTFPSYNQTIDPNVEAFAAAQESLGEQIRQLTADLDSVKRQVNTPPPTPPSVSAPAGTPPGPEATASVSHPPLTVVLKNGQRLSVQSYAVMNGTFWDFSKQPVRKIPLSGIDVPESVKAAEANGTEFPDISSASQVTVSH